MEARAPYGHRRIIPETLPRLQPPTSETGSPMSLLDHAAIATRTGPLSGTIRVPGDKSISHRSIMLGALSVGRSEVTGLLEGEDVHATAAAMRALGAHVEKLDEGHWIIDGVGVGGLGEPDDVLNLGNSGTSARLITGMLAGHKLVAVMTGDASLRRRPMARVIDPLTTMGARFVARAGNRLPLTIIGNDRLLPATYRLPVASAQVKSALMLAALNTSGTSTIIEPTPTRDHSETMLAAFGARIVREEIEDGATAIQITGPVELTPNDVDVPGDISSAAFPLVAAAIRPGSDLVLENVGLNPRRTGIIDCLQEMGADLTITDRMEQAGEARGTLTIRGGALKGIEVPPERAPSMIDEYPVLAVAAACAEGETRMTGIGELRVKESDRLAAVADGLINCGVKVELGDDWMVVHGTGKPPTGGATVKTHLDHRIAMSFLVLGMASDEPVAVDDAEPINTSFPGFLPMMNRLGAMEGGNQVPLSTGGDE